MSDPNDKQKCAKPHGHSNSGGIKKASPTYVSWRAMRTRVTNPRRADNKYYKDRGIGSCERWEKFANFLADMGERPQGTSLDRIDNLKGYEPGNCRWATPAEQTRNRRVSKINFDVAVKMIIERRYGASIREIASRYGCSESLPREVCKGRVWPDALAYANRLPGDGV